MQRNQQPWRQLPPRPKNTAAAAAIAAFPPNPRPPQSNLSSIRRFPVSANDLPPKLSPPPSGYDDEEEPCILDDNAPPPPLAPPTTVTPRHFLPTQRNTVPSAVIHRHPQGGFIRPQVPGPSSSAHSGSAHSSSAHYPPDTDPRLAELITRLFISAGVPLSAVTGQAFADMIKHFNSSTVLPTETAMARGLEKHCKNQRPVANYMKSLAPLCVTIDVGHGTGDSKFLAYSIHYFEDLYERKNVVYLKKLLLSVCDAESIFILIRRAVNSYSYSTVKFANLVCPTPEIYKMLCGSEICKKYYVDFNFYIKKFVLNVLKIQELSQGLTQLRTFCRFIKSGVDVYGKYRRMQLAKGREMNVPDVDNESWVSTVRFLTQCLALNDDFNEYCLKFNHQNAITNETYLELLYFQRLLHECLKHSEAISAPDNSISQVMPSIMALRNYISMSKPAESYANQVRDAFTNSFSSLTRGTAKIHYDLATLMDPRYAYKTEIYNMQTWQNLEIRAIEAFKDMDPASEKCYYNDVTLLKRDEKHAVIAQDFETYRDFLVNGRSESGISGIHRDHRPLPGETPNFWWGRRQTDMEYLAILAREYLATPASVVDASRHFNKGKGKFDRISKMYPRSLIDDCLAVAGTYQPYRGKGHLVEKNRVMGGTKETLDAVEKRLITNGMIEREQQMMRMEEEMKQEPQMEVKVEEPIQPPPPKKRRGIMRR